MRIHLFTIGSRGDVQPFVALGSALRRAGHHVTLCTHAQFEPLARRHGLDFAALAGDPGGLLQTDAGLSWLEAANNPVAFVRGARRLMLPLVEAFLQDAWRAAQGAQLLVCSFTGVGVTAIARKLGIPCVLAPVHPLVPTRQVRSPVFPCPDVAWGLYRALTHHVAQQFAWQPFRGAVSRWCTRELQVDPPGLRGPLDELLRGGLPVVCGFSSHLVAVPTDWPAQVHVTGCWFVDTEDAPSQELVEFVEGGPAPVVIGFGSMTDREPQALTALVLDAARRAGQRVVLLTGWGATVAPEHTGGDVLAIPAAPHGWLFPRARAVVHHGGVGTTAAALRAGVPGVVVPYFGDQYFWGWAVHQRGAGPAPVPRRQLTVERLAQALTRAVESREMLQAAQDVARGMAAEPGVTRAAEILGTIRLDGAAGRAA